MPLITRSIPENPTARRVMGSRLPATLGETIEATVEDPLLRPTQMAFQAEDPDVDPVEIAASRVPMLDRDEEETVAPEELNTEFSDIGLSFDKPVPRSYAETLATRKREEIIRNDVIARGPQGVGPTTLKFGAMLAGSAIDPINIASAFIPVLGEARFAGMVAKFGATRARLARGMIEGAVGNAAIEPLTFGLAQRQQMDYEFSDSLVNIGLGGLLGGGLHAGAGKISDFVSARSPKVRDQALRSSVAQMAEGRKPNVEPVFRMDELTQDIRAQRGGQTAAAERLISVMEFSERPTRPVLSGVRGKLAAFVQEQRENIRAVRAERDELQQRKIPSIKEMERRIRAEDPQQPAREVKRQARDLVQQQKEQTQALRNRAEERIQTHEKAESELRNLDAQIQNRETPDVKETAKRLEQELPGLDLSEFRVVDADDLSSRMTFDDAVREATRVAREEAAPERDITADFDASSRIHQSIEQEVTAEQEAEFAEESLNALRNEGILTQAQEEEMSMLDALVAKAERYGEAARNAARCVSR